MKAAYPEYNYVSSADGVHIAYVQSAEGKANRKAFAESAKAIAWARRRATQLLLRQTMPEVREYPHN